MVIAYDDSISVYYQSNTGLFTKECTKYYNGVRAYGIDCGDLNNDGLDDIAVTNFNDVNLKVYYQLSSGGFDIETYNKPISGQNDLEIVDINNDGLNDLVMSTSNSMVGYEGYDLYTFCIYLQDEQTNQFTYLTYYDIKNTQFNRLGYMAIGDLNNDGLLDIAVTTSFDVYIFYQDETNPDLFDTWAVELNKCTNPSAIVIADLNNDGKAEILVQNDGYGSFSIYESDSLFQFEDYIGYKIGPSYSVLPDGLSVRDMDGDSIPDLVTTGGQGTAIYKNTTMLDISIDELPKDNGSTLVINPNPANNYINIELKDSHANIKVEIINMVGTTVLEQSFNSSQLITLNFNLPDGLYFLSVSDANNISVRKVYIRNN